jgi:hypothetical protein
LVDFATGRSFHASDADADRKLAVEPVSGQGTAACSSCNLVLARPFGFIHAVKKRKVATHMDRSQLPCCQPWICKRKLMDEKNARKEAPWTAQFTAQQGTTKRKFENDTEPAATPKRLSHVSAQGQPVD